MKRNENNKILYKNMMPSNWNKIGEVYGNLSGQSMFVCFICLENAKTMDSVYDTSDASAFSWHIKQQHTCTFQSNEIVKQKPVETLSTNTRQCYSNGEISEPKSLYGIPNAENETQFLEIFHQNLVEKLTSTYETPNKKFEENYQNSNCYQSYAISGDIKNNGTIEISDDEEDPNLTNPTNLQPLLSGLSYADNSTYRRLNIWNSTKPY